LFIVSFGACAVVNGIIKVVSCVNWRVFARSVLGTTELDLAVVLPGVDLLAKERNLELGNSLETEPRTNRGLVATFFIMVDLYLLGRVGEQCEGV